jgi:glycosyltransferase involved in cell wall biosynthesis
MSKKIAIILPAYNEGKVIGQVLSELPNILDHNGSKYAIDIIVVNDGSTDNTTSAISKKGSVILINHLINSGPGAATRTGLHYARDNGYEYVVTMDSDGQHHSKDVVRIIKAILENEADFVIGSRLKAFNGNMPAYKKIGNIGLGAITFFLLGVYASDTQSGLKAFNRTALETVEFHSNNYAFCSEMIWKAHQAKLRIEEIPIQAIYTQYSLSRGQRNIKGAFDITVQLIKRRFLEFLNG